MTSVTFNTTLTLGGQPARLAPASFVVNGATYCGVLVGGGIGNEFSIDQRAGFHRIRAGDTVYITTVSTFGLTGNASLLALFGGALPAVILAAVRQEARVYLLAPGASGVQTASTVDLTTTGGPFVINAPGSALYWGVDVNTGAFAGTTNAATASIPSSANGSNTTGGSTLSVDYLSTPGAVSTVTGLTVITNYTADPAVYTLGVGAATGATKVVALANQGCLPVELRCPTGAILLSSYQPSVQLVWLAAAAPAGTTPYGAGQWVEMAGGQPWYADRWLQTLQNATPTDLKSTGSRGAAVALSADGLTLVIGCPLLLSGAAGATWVYNLVEGTWTTKQLLVGTNAMDSAQGVAVAISADGLTIAVGAPDHDSGVGAVWTFALQGDAWVQTAGPFHGDADSQSFGRALALSADGLTLVVGDPGNTAGDAVGATWVYVWAGGAWTAQTSPLIGTGASAGVDTQGRAVAISNNTIVVGAANGIGGEGVWVFTRNGTTWSQQDGKILPNNEVGPGAEFGTSVAVIAGASPTSAATFMAGGPADGAVTNGAVWEFTRAAGASAWVQGTKLTETVPSGTLFGFSLSITGLLPALTLMVGWPGYVDPDSSVGCGAVVFYTRTDDVWSSADVQVPDTSLDIIATESIGTSVAVVEGQAATGAPGFEVGAVKVGKVYTAPAPYTTYTGFVPPAPSSSRQGTAVAVSADGRTVAVGAPGQDSLVGAVFIYVDSVLQTTIGGDSAGDLFGSAVAISANGRVLAVGAPGAPGDDGSVSTYAFAVSSWSLRETIAGGGSGNFGAAVALSADGNMLAVGEPVGAVGNGAAYAYDWDGAAWQLNTTLAASAVEEFGYAVALSGDASTLVVGAPARGAGAGAIIVFRYTGSTYAVVGTYLTGATGRLGAAVAAGQTGTTVVAGAPAASAGAGVVVSYLLTTAYAPIQVITNPAAPAADEFGTSVATTPFGGTLVVGAPSADGNDGAAYVFSRPSGTATTPWFLVATLAPHVSGESAEFGTAVAMDGAGAVVVVGEPRLADDVSDVGDIEVFV